MKSEAAQFEIKKSYLFSNLDQSEVNELSRLAQLEVLNPGDALYSHGQTIDSFYLVHYGTVKVGIIGTEGEAEVHFVIGNGGTIGEASLVSDRPRISEAHAIERTEVVKISVEKLRAFFDRHPTAATKVYRALAEHFAYSLSHLGKEMVRMRESQHFGKHKLASL
jgi:CRP-like cAMP-binding protein